MSDIYSTPDLSSEYHPIPKTYKAKKMPKGVNKMGKKVVAWEIGRKQLKSIFLDYGIRECEINLPKCNHKEFLGFAHIRRRNTLTPEQTIDPHFVVLACTNCHDEVDNKMPKDQSERFLDSIVKARGW